MSVLGFLGVLFVLAVVHLQSGWDPGKMKFFGVKPPEICIMNGCENEREQGSKFCRDCGGELKNLRIKRDLEKAFEKINKRNQRRVEK